MSKLKGYYVARLSAMMNIPDEPDYQPKPTLLYFDGNQFFAAKSEEPINRSLLHSVSQEPISVDTPYGHNPTPNDFQPIEPKAWLERNASEKAPQGFYFVSAGIGLPNTYLFFDGEDFYSHGREWSCPQPQILHRIADKPLVLEQAIKSEYQNIDKWVRA